MQRRSFLKSAAAVAVCDALEARTGEVHVQSLQEWGGA